MDIVPFSSSTRIQIDEALSWVPVVSFLNSFVDIFQKAVVIPLSSDETVKKNHYYKHLNQKSYTECIVLAIPLVNIVAKYFLYGKKTASVPLPQSKIESTNPSGTMVNKVVSRIKPEVAGSNDGGSDTMVVNKQASMVANASGTAVISGKPQGGLDVEEILKGEGKPTSEIIQPAFQNLFQRAAFLFELSKDSANRLKVLQTKLNEISPQDPNIRAKYSELIKKEIAEREKLFEGAISKFSEFFRTNKLDEKSMKIIKDIYQIPSLKLFERYLQKATVSKNTLNKADANQKQNRHAGIAILANKKCGEWIQHIKLNELAIIDLAKEFAYIRGASSKDVAKDLRDWAKLRKHIEGEIAKERNKHPATSHPIAGINKMKPHLTHGGGASPKSDSPNASTPSSSPSTPSSQPSSSSATPPSKNASPSSTGAAGSAPSPFGLQ